MELFHPKQISDWTLKSLVVKSLKTEIMYAGLK